MKALIIEDEKAAVRNLQAVLARVAPEVEVIEVLDSVEDALDWFATHSMPELIFVDIHFKNFPLTCEFAYCLRSVKTLK